MPGAVDPAEAVSIQLGYLTAFQMLTRCCRLSRGSTILVVGASGTVGTALLDLARHLGFKVIGTCSAANLSVVERYGAQTMASGHEGLLSAALGLARIKLWGLLGGLLFGGRRAVFYSITAHRSAHLAEFKGDMAALLELLRETNPPRGD